MTEPMLSNFIYVVFKLASAAVLFQFDDQEVILVCSPFMKDYVRPAVIIICFCYVKIAIKLRKKPVNFIS